MTEAPIATPVAEVETMTEAPNPVAETETMTASAVSTTEIGTITEAEVCAVEIHQVCDASLSRCHGWNKIVTRCIPAEAMVLSGRFLRPKWGWRVLQKKKTKSCPPSITLGYGSAKRN